MRAMHAHRPRHLRRRSALVILLGAFYPACSAAPETAPAPEPLADATAGRPDDGAADTDAAATTLDPTTYCERSRELFCGFYVRCGRMAAADVAECLEAFDEACNARYEPFYADLAARGALSLSKDGLARCATHLETVACDQQISDLDGCADVWLGHVPTGGRCGPGLESFVCGEADVCVLGLNFCGTCFASAGLGAPCDDTTRCADGAACVSGTCVARPRPGEACGEPGALPCVVGSDCEGGRCSAPAPRQPGESCSRDGDCVYRAACRGGVCVKGGLLGDPCSDVIACASGWCDGGTCAPLLPAGAACTGAAACTSRVCTEGRCAPIGWNCLDAP
jgi:hypothetical protein